ncbi:hypothetical protein D9M72_489280 [compost metagenome]
MAYFLARSTTFCTTAPELKSLKYSISVSPLAYVTSRYSLDFSVEYIASTVRWIMASTVAWTSPLCSARSDSWNGRSVVMYL